MAYQEMNGPRLIANASAVILAGGKSSRMGRPKALLPFDGQPLIVHIVGALEKLFSDIVIVASPAQELPELPVTLVRDEVPFQGPVGGIYYGLGRARGDYCFVTSCDVAFLNLPLIATMLSAIVDHDVVVPQWQNRLQPLYAVYRRSLFPLLRAQLERSELRPVALYDKVRTRTVSEEEIRRYDPEGLCFLNMNTPADYEAALERWTAAGGILDANNANQRAAKMESTVSRSFETDISDPRAISNSVTVELFGVARLLAKTPKVSLTVSDETDLGAVLAALATQLPVLVGRVIDPAGALVKGCACNLNGLNFIASPNSKVLPGDRIFILSADAGG
jgi:molybdopterin-guanine dinucleotide biosynthesis protein A